MDTEEYIIYIIYHIHPIMFSSISCNSKVAITVMWQHLAFRYQSFTRKHRIDMEAYRELLW